MKKVWLFLSLALLAQGCASKTPSVPEEWPWTDPKEEPVTPEESNPAIVAQGWTAVSGQYAALPEGIRIYKSPDQLCGTPAIAYIAVAQRSSITWDVWSIHDPKTTGTDEDLKTPAEIFTEKAAPVVINGGYFFVEGGKQYNASVAVSGGKTYGVNLNYASQDWETYYYPTRGVFYEDEDELACGWTYYTASGQHYLYDSPADNAWEKAPLAVPNAQFPVAARDFSVKTAIGAGPVLVKGGEIVNSWQAELFYGNGSDDKQPRSRQPRTAIGCSEDRLILFVCEGRGMTEGVQGLTLDEVASVMKSLGCEEALNLDGGGSSCMLVSGLETIQVSDGAQRAVGSILYLKNK